MNFRDLSLRWKIALPIIIFVTVGIIISISLITANSRRIVMDEVGQTTLPAYRDTVLNALTTMMIAGNFKEAKGPFVEQMTHIADVRIIRTDSLDKDYGKGGPDEYAKDDIERAVVTKGTERIVIEGEYLRGVYPYIAKTDFMGKNCLGSCHTVGEGTVLGAISIKIPLTAAFGKIRTLRNLYFGLGLMGVLLVALAIIFMVMTALKPFVALKGKVDVIAGGDLRVNIEVQSKDEIGQLLQAMKNMVNKLKSVVADVKGASYNVASGSQELSSGAQQLSQGATEQAASVEETSSYMEEMKSTITQNADNAVQTEKIARKSADGRCRKRDRGHPNSGRHERDRIKDIDNRRDRAPDEPPGFERGDRGGPGRRTWQGLCGGGIGGPETRGAEPDSRGRDQSRCRNPALMWPSRRARCWRSLYRTFRRPRSWCRRSARPRRSRPAGSDQISAAIQQLNQVIQQNAGAAEELASTAEELSSQADQLQSTISFFKVDEDGGQQMRREGTTAKKFSI